jgi:hypothetical protein
VRPTGHPDLSEYLLGFLAPSAWTILGFVGEGVAYEITDVSEPQRLVGNVHDEVDADTPRHVRARPDGADPRAVRAALLVQRDGTSSAVVRRRGHTAAVVPTPEGCSGGLLHDLCRRALRLPTAPPPGSTLELWSRLWLDRVLHRIGADIDRNRGLDWPQLAALHPAMSLLGCQFADDPALRDPDGARQLVLLGRLLASLHTWSALREACETGACAIDGITPHTAGWLDDGAFSRWVLGGLPPSAELYDAVGEVLAPRLTKPIAVALAAWGSDGQR